MHRCSCPPLLSGVHGWRGFPTRSKYGLVGLGYCPRGTPPSESDTPVAMLAQGRWLAVQAWIFCA